MSEISKTYEKAKTRVEHNVLRLGVLYATGFAGLLLKSVPGSRDHLPEPFDVPDHAGNLNGSVMLGYASGMLAGEIYSRYAQDSEPKEAVRKTRTVMALAGFCVGLVANATTETKLGLSVVPGAWGTPDSVDLFYGAVASAVGAAVGPSVSGIDTSNYAKHRYFEDSAQNSRSENLVDSQ